MKNFVAVLVLLLITGESNAQLNRYVLRLKDKGLTPYTLSNPSPYLSTRAINRRLRFNIPIDSTDLPVPAQYVSTIQNIPNVTVHNTSRWLNALTIHTTDPNAIIAINALPFVQSTTAIAARPGNIHVNKFNEQASPLTSSPTARMHHENGFFNYGGGASLREILLHNGNFLHDIGLRGQGMQISLLDGGFNQYTTMDALDSAVNNGQFLSTWDFVNREASVEEDSQHGMSCLSTIAANIPGLFIGTAPKSNFHLFKTEDNNSEYPIEEFNWVCGAERADSAGTDVISSSIGYGYEFNPPVPDYPYSTLNGNTTMAAIGADLAAKKGILVVQSAGNSGLDYWKNITTPADADSVLVVGAVNAIDSTVGAFSSYGPSGDGQVKPDVASAGVLAVIQLNNNTVSQGNGTSYATPKMAGLATCLWQGFPEVNNMRIIRALREASHQYNNPNDRVGYGIPDMKKAVTKLLQDYSTASSEQTNCEATLTWRSKDVSSMRYEIESAGPDQPLPVVIASINAQPGNMFSTHQYEHNFQLINSPAGTYTFTIYQLLDTNTATRYRINLRQVTLQLTDPCNIEDVVMVTPNPPTSHPAKLIVQSRFEISMVHIHVYDMKGSLVYQYAAPKPAGRTIIDLPSNKWAKGKYIINVYNGKDKMGTTNLIKL